MKLLVTNAGFKAGCITILCLFYNAVIKGQGADSSVNNNGTGYSAKTGAAWYTQPWAWILGAVVFLLLLAALLSDARKKGDRVVNKHSSNDRDTAL